MHHTATFRTHPPPQAAGVQRFFLDDDEPPAAGSRPDRVVCRVRTARVGSAAQRGAVRGDRALGADPRRSCAADG